MAGETNIPRYQFISPLKSIGQGGITRNFPLGLGGVDFQNLQKNKPHFEELAATFGMSSIRGLIYKNTAALVKTAPTSKKDQYAFPSEAAGEDEPLTKIGTSILGMPVYSNLSIKAGSYNDNSGETIAQYDDIRVDACIFELSRENNLIVTDIQGRDNSVIEYVSGKSWTINCKGRIMAKNRNTYPTTDVVQLINALNSNKSLKVDSWFLNMLGIYNIVIKKKLIPQEEGGIEYQKFEFDAIADYPLILRRPKP